MWGIRTSEPILYFFQLDMRYKSIIRTFCLIYQNDFVALKFAYSYPLFIREVCKNFLFVALKLKSCPIIICAIAQQQLSTVCKQLVHLKNTLTLIGNIIDGITIACILAFKFDINIGVVIKMHWKKHKLTNIILTFV